MSISSSMHTHQKGLTLLELMVAMAVSLLLMTGVIEIFGNNKKTYFVAEDIARMQEGGRFAMHVLTKNIRSADHWGCNPSPNNITNNVNGGGPGGIDFGAGGILGTNNDGLNGSDSITLQGGQDDLSINITPPWMPTTAAALSVSVPNDLQPWDIIMVTSCSPGNINPANSGGDIFQITSQNPNTNGTVGHNGGVGTPGNINQTLSRTYAGDASVQKMSSITYFIAAGASGEPALFRTENNAPAIELVEGVEDMQILYGEDTNGDQTADRYLPAPADPNAPAVGEVQDMDTVVSVRVTLTIRSLRDNPLISGDQRRRHTITTTTTIRNRTS